MTFACSCTRTELGLADLNLNDHINYYVSNDSIFSGTVQYRRNTVTSPYVASGVTVNAVADLVQDVFAVEVLGGTSGALGTANNYAAIVAAFGQYDFNLTFSFDSGVYTYACQTSDYTTDWTQGRGLANQLEVKFTLYRSPIAINGA